MSDESSDYMEETTGNEFPVNQKRSKPLEQSPVQKRLKTNSNTLMAELGLEKVETVGIDFNCLAFSVLMATGRIGFSLEAQREAAKQANEERRDTHDEIMGKIPGKDDDTKEGPHEAWWAGKSKAKLTDIFERLDFMSEAHVHGFANRLGRTIIVLDEQKPAPFLMKYSPGYAVQKQIPTRTAKEIRAQDEQPVWLLMSPGHWSALIPQDMGVEELSDG